ncbi:D-amino-acid oxidase [Mycena filopes]|nr:D-amino-acid oxidase [Mycena filopes]
MKDNREIFVVGAGVVGLSTAIRAQEVGFNVTIFAEIFPGDKKRAEYASCWAGADHISLAINNELMHRLERKTFSAFAELLKADPDVPVMVLPHIEYGEDMNNDTQSKCYSDYRPLESNELPEGVVRGSLFSTFHVDVPRYLPYLVKRFLASGGRAFRVTLPSLSALLSQEHRPALAPFPPGSTTTLPSFNPVAVMNCTGIGALSIGDVLDSNVYPTRGEILIVRAPWIKRGSTYYFKDGHTTYIIPRQSGDVILGGTYQPNDWHPTSRPETVRLLKQRGLKVFPELLPKHKRATGGINDIDVVEECVGYRPSRKGDVRVEAGILNFGGRKVPVVHNYGHGGAGYQASWGSAEFAVELLKSALATARL